MSREDGAASTSAFDSAEPPMRRVRVHKMRPPTSAAAALSLKDQYNGAAEPRSALHSAMDRRIAELVPGLAELSISAAGPSSAAMNTAAQIRSWQLAKEAEAAKNADVQELDSIYDMSVKHPADYPSSSAAANWTQTLKPRPRKISLSPYQLHCKGWGCPLPEVPPVTLMVVKERSTADVAQTEMINYQRMHLRKNIWFYRDRMSTPRGPCPLHVLKDAYVQGVVDENTLVWGQGLYDWLPMKNVKLLLPMIRTPEVRFGAWFKRTFSLKPALNRIREQRAAQRDPENLSLQVERMR